MSERWTKPHFGVSHLGDLGDARRATVCDHGSFTELSMWYRGCGFSPHESTFKTVGEAKSAGERWVASGVLPAKPETSVEALAGSGAQP